MHIEFIEVQNFRKLKSVRIDFSDKTTVFVGANNSGKTSAMTALGHFLIDHSRFNPNDFTLSNWSILKKIGKAWETLGDRDPIPTLSDWIEVLPTLDIWLNVSKNEIHHVSSLIPSLDWDGGLIGVRLRFEPKVLEDFFKEYIVARKSRIETVKAAQEKNPEGKYTLNLWPSNMTEFLIKRLNHHFTVRGYLLDPSLIKTPKYGLACPQDIPIDTDALEGNPLKGLLRIDEINAQRGFSDSNPNDKEDSGEKGNKRKLSDQLRNYFARHIDPTEEPEPSDVDALQAIHDAQSAFDGKLKTNFDLSFNEIGDLGYPGINDLELILSTKIHPMDGLNHSSALQYKVNSTSDDEDGGTPTLPEQYNGLGYQNLISMVFRLMGFRDHWLRFGKAGKKAAEKGDGDTYIPPLHIVLVEEPEAHLHVQVQQVFIKKAYHILRNRPELKENKELSTQLIVSTHSSHIAHECDFSWLRYFRRKPALDIKEVPTTTVINLSEVFGKLTETQRFVTRYLRTTHCDLFFADAAILVEGPAERTLVPHFIRSKFEKLNQSYITILEINGSHAHRLRPLIEHLGLITLIITDLDAGKKTSDNKLPAVPPQRSDNQVSRNTTIRQWVPAEKKLDILLDLTPDKKILKLDDFSSIRVSYQMPIKTEYDSKDVEFLPNTFEDSLLYSNIATFPTLNGYGILRKFKTLLAKKLTPLELSNELVEVLSKGDKADFALTMLTQDFTHLIIPQYIYEGLVWLEQSLTKKLLDIIKEDVVATADVPILEKAERADDENGLSMLVAKKNC